MEKARETVRAGLKEFESFLNPHKVPAKAYRDVAIENLKALGLNEEQIKKRLPHEIDSIKHVAHQTREDWDKAKRDRDARYEKTAPDDEEPAD